MDTNIHPLWEEKQSLSDLRCPLKRDLKSPTPVRMKQLLAMVRSGPTSYCWCWFLGFFVVSETVQSQDFMCDLYQSLLFSCHLDKGLEQSAVYTSYSSCCFMLYQRCKVQKTKLLWDAGWFLSIPKRLLLLLRPATTVRLSYLRQKLCVCTLVCSQSSLHALSCFFL